MTAVPPTTANVAADDSRAIEELHTAFGAQKSAFAANPAPSLERRRASLNALAGVILKYRDQIRAALSADFAVHPEVFADFTEVLGIAGRTAYAAEQLDEWMRPEVRDADPALYGDARVEVRRDPKGVVGIISPWNFPFELSLGPLADTLAAGNRAIIKPSEFTPACSAVLAQMIAEAFQPDEVTVVAGGVEVAREFSTLAWDHLLYTGNPEVGRLIARAAADNLVPTTLELGGKCPAIVLDDAVTAETVRQIIGTKLIKSGQMCISVDYCLVPRSSLPAFTDLVTAHLRDNLPDFASSGDCTGIITERHLGRLVDMIEEARDRGVEVIQVDDNPVNSQTRQMGLTLVIDPPEDLALMREEIFGPILPIKPYDDVDEAIAFVNAGDRPLGLYVFATDEDRAEKVIGRTSSGGACINTCAIQGAIPALGFGGIGRSGTGRHHGIDGFREFTNPRGVVRRGSEDLIAALHPPYGGLVDAVIAAGYDAVDAQAWG